jgi:hypothetical protein
VQLNVKSVAAVMAAVVSVPLIAFAPDQPPDAVQLVAFVELQVSIVVPPLVTLVGFALKVTVGTGGVTVTFAVAFASPPAPVQVSVNVLFAVRAAEAALPDIAFEPVQAPDAVQLVASIELHVSMVVAPLATVVGLADNATVGAGGFSVVAAPPPQAFSTSVQASALIRKSVRRGRIRIGIEQFNPDYVDYRVYPHLRELALLQRSQIARRL